MIVSPRDQPSLLFGRAERWPARKLAFPVRLSAARRVQMRVFDERRVHAGSPGKERKDHGARTNPEINVIVYHRGNVIPDREDKWQRNTIRRTAVGRSRPRDEEPFRSSYLHTAAKEDP